MAQSARLQSLLSRRTGSLYGTSGKIRILSAANTTIASIAKKTVTSELEIMTKNYNDGQVSNADFRAFLEKMLSTQGVSDADKNDIQGQIRDFDSRIQGDNLLQAYKSAPDNTLQQVQAAQNLANYFRNRASGMQPDTPAYNDNLQNAIAYDQKVVTINDNVQKIARQNKRYLLEQKVNQISSGTSENSSAKAQMWKELYDQAIADGDTVAANQYAAYYEKELTKADDLSTKETTASNKKTLSDFINTTLNDYHDGKISGDDALLQLQKAEQFAYDANDTAAQNRLNSLSITINREIDKGVVYSSEGGLSQKSKGGGGGSGEMYLNPDGSVSYGGGYAPAKSVGTKITSTGQKPQGTQNNAKPATTFTNGRDRAKSFSELDLDYKNDLIKVNKDLVSGEITPEQYQKAIMLIAKSREIDLQDITTGLGNIVAQNPKAKFGKKEIATILDDYTKELGQVTAEYNGIRTGELVLKMDKKTYTDPSGTEIHIPELRMVSKKEIGKDINANGIYYTPRDELVDAVFNSKKEANAALGVLDNGQSYSVKNKDGKYQIVDNSGNTIQFPNQVLDLNDTQGNSIPYENSPLYGWIPVATGPKTGALRSDLMKDYERTGIKNENFRTYGYLSSKEPVFKDGQWTYHSSGIPTPPQAPKEPNIIDKVVSATEDIGNKVVAPLNLDNMEQPQVGQGNQLVKLSQSPLSPKQPVISATNLNTGQAVKSPVAPTALTLAGAKPKTTVPLPAGQKPVAIPAPKVDPKKIDAQVKAAQQRDTSLAGSAKALVKNIGGFFGIK